MQEAELAKELLELVEAAQVAQIHWLPGQASDCVTQLWESMVREIREQKLAVIKDKTRLEDVERELRESGQSC